MNKKWIVKSDKLPSNLEEVKNILLSERGIEDEDKFFNPQLSDIHNPNLLYDIDRAVDFILKLKKANERVYVYGDYDADGILATTILWNYLYKELELDVFPMIPDRIEDGYGMNDNNLSKISEDKAKAVITVDCGVRDFELITKWQDKGLGFLITDHHEFSLDEEGNPQFNEDAIYIHPRHPKGEYPNKYISGGVVAWKLIWAIEQRLTKNYKTIPQKILDYLDLAALSTVSDIMPLIDENRSIVIHGIEKMRKTTNPGLKQLFEDSSVEPKEISSYHLGYVIAPRINAAGRIGDAMDSVRLLSSNKPDYVRKYSTKLNALNQERQGLTKDFLENFKKNNDLRELSNKKIIIVRDESLHEGVIGLVAGKLCEQYKKPVIVFTRSKEEFLKGSARSIPEFDITNALSQFSDLLEQYGGHTQAAGLTIKEVNFEMVKTKLEAYALENVTDEDIKQAIEIDTELSADTLTLELVDLVDKFEPFGHSNKKPLFYTKDLIVSEYSVISGKTGDHLKLFLRSGNLGFEAIGFGLGKEKIEVNDKISVAFYAERNNWNGNSKFQLVIKDFKN